MSHRVRVGNKNSVSISIAPKGVFIRTKEGQIMAKAFHELIDVDVTGVHDKYIIMYDASTDKYTAVNPDDILIAASSTETEQPGLPIEFINTLDVDLDNKIDLDAGEF